MIKKPPPEPTVPPDLIVIMPVYNEQASIRKVVSEWFQEIENWTESFVFLVINDGSRDETLRILERLQTQLGSRLEVLHQENKGHGQSCIRGYDIACERDAEFILQIDSDGQCDPQYFWRLWRLREEFDVIYGNRTRRDDGLRRVVASVVLRSLLLFGFGVNCVDANVPYRLMRTKKIQKYLAVIPKYFVLANVALAYLLKKAGLRHGSVPIRFRERYGGEPSVRMGQFGSKALELVGQLKGLTPKNEPPPIDSRRE